MSQCAELRGWMYGPDLCRRALKPIKDIASLLCCKVAVVWREKLNWRKISEWHVYFLRFLIDFTTAISIGGKYPIQYHGREPYWKKNNVIKMSQPADEIMKWCAWIVRAFIKKINNLFHERLIFLREIPTKVTFWVEKIEKKSSAEMKLKEDLHCTTTHTK